MKPDLYFTAAVTNRARGFGFKDGMNGGYPRACFKVVNIKRWFRCVGWEMGNGVSVSVSSMGVVTCLWLPTNWNKYVLLNELWAWKLFIVYADNRLHLKKSTIMRELKKRVEIVDDGTDESMKINHEDVLGGLIDTQIKSLSQLPRFLADMQV
uniref:Uncharacterized protein n=1 Tax=Romanomermis culicivorax TaxID=13658 RepID=A0A915KLI8_ROMCU